MLQGYAPIFQVKDTESSLSAYAPKTKTINLKDLVKMHGHPCDGLVTAAHALSLGLKSLYPDGVIDRTDTGCITNNSPCFGDVAAYLTGGRIRFGTQKIDVSLGNEFILHRFSTKKTVKVTMNKGVFPKSLKALESKVKSGNFTPEEMNRCKIMAWEFAKTLLSTPAENSFTVTPLPNYQWKADNYEHLGKRGDVINKNAPTQ